MKKYIFINILLVIAFSCSEKNSQEEEKAMNYKLTWGMISNYLEGKSSCRAAFTIHNTTNQKLGNKGWTIFYSQSPRRVTNHSNSNANINQINGDWYSITPNESFSALDIISLILNAALSLNLIIGFIINLTPILLLLTSYLYSKVGPKLTLDQHLLYLQLVKLLL